MSIKVTKYKVEEALLPAMRFTVTKLKEKKNSQLREQVEGLTSVILAYGDNDTEEEINAAVDKLQSIIDLIAITK